MERYTLEEHEAYRKEQDEKAAKEEEARNERTEKASARRAWMADGGSEADFEKAWPQLRDEGRRRRGSREVGMPLVVGVPEPHGWPGATASSAFAPTIGRRNYRYHVRG
jgi:hypothetical protein